MPIVQVGGKNISFPDNMSNEEIKNVLDAKFQNQPEQTNAGQEAVRPFARAARTGLAGLASIADLGGVAVEPIRQGMRSGLEALGVDFMGQNTPYVPPSEGVKNLFDRVTGNIAQPRTSGEKIVDVAGEALAGGGVVKGAQTLAKGGSALLEKIAPQTGKELLSIAGGGAGAEIAQQVAPDNPIAPIIGAFVGGYSTSKGVDAIRNSGDIKLLDKAYFNRMAQRNPEQNTPYFEKQAQKVMQKNLPKDSRTLASLKGQLQQDKNLLIPDIGGDEVRALTRQVGKFKGGARNDIDKFLTQRDAEAGQRIIKAINTNVSGVDKYYSSLDDVIATRSELAKQQYRPAFEKYKNIKPTPQLNKFIQDGRFQSALDDARASGVININEPVTSLETLNKVYRTLRDNAREAVQKGKGNLGDSLNQMSRDFVRTLDDIAPEYKQARNTFAGVSDLIDAQEQGLKYANYRPEQLQKILSQMNASEQAAYKVGVRESLEKKILTSGAKADEASKIFGKPENRQQLKAILGDEYKDFSQRMRKEIAMADTKFKVLGGSRTDFNTIEDGNFIESAANLARNGKVALIDETVGIIADSIKRKYFGINENNAKILAKALVSNKGGVKMLDDLITQTKSKSMKLQLQQFKEDYQYLFTPLAQQTDE